VIQTYQTHLDKTGIILHLNFVYSRHERYPAVHGSWDHKRTRGTLLGPEFPAKVTCPVSANQLPWHSRLGGRGLLPACTQDLHLCVSQLTALTQPSGWAWLTSSMLTRSSSLCEPINCLDTAVWVGVAYFLMPTRSSSLCEPISCLDTAVWVGVAYFLHAHKIFISVWTVGDKWRLMFLYTVKLTMKGCTDSLTKVMFLYTVVIY